MGLTRDEVVKLVTSFKRSAWRLETRQSYDVPAEADRVRAFREGRPIPPAPTGWLQPVRDAVAAGKRMGRVHVVDEPLSDYLRFELAVYRENVAAGEDVGIARRAPHPALRNLTEDFILFDADTDAPTVVWLRYSDAGRVLGYDRGSDDDVARCVAQRDLALACAVPLDEFAAAIQGV